MPLKKTPMKLKKKSKTGGGGSQGKARNAGHNKKKPLKANPLKPKKSAKGKASQPARKKPSLKTSKRVMAPLRSPKTSATKKKRQGAARGSRRTISLRERAFQNIRERLIQQKNSLITEAEEALNALPDQTIFPALTDQASAENDRSFMLKLRGREQRLIKKIESAIEKIDNNTFGTCDVCGQEINIKRLEARPVTTLCIDCKTEQEEEEKLRGL